MPGYVELQICSAYSFLRGASRIEELRLQAKALGYEALAVTDHDTLAGIARARARAHAKAKEVEIRLVVGCRLNLADAPPMLAYPTDRAGWARLCRLLTLISVSDAPQSRRFSGNSAGSEPETDSTQVVTDRI